MIRGRLPHGAETPPDRLERLVEVGERQLDQRQQRGYARDHDEAVPEPPARPVPLTIGPGGLLVEAPHAPERSRRAPGERLTRLDPAVAAAVQTIAHDPEQHPRSGRSALASKAASTWLINPRSSDTWWSAGNNATRSRRASVESRSSAYSTADAVPPCPGWPP